MPRRRRCRVEISYHRLRRACRCLRRLVARTWPTPPTTCTTPNFGCSVQHNIAAMVADPRDLLGPRAHGCRPMRRAAPTVMDHYEKGEVTQADKHTADKATEQSGAASDVGSNVGGTRYERSCKHRKTEAFGAAPHERPVPRISIHAFCEFPDTGAALQRAGADRRLVQGASARCSWAASMPPSSIINGQVTPNLLIVETRLQRQGGAGRTRPAGRSLRSRHQGDRGRPRQRRGAVSRTDAPRRSANIWSRRSSRCS